MKQYNVSGMSCAACSARVEKAVLGVEGVTYCSVNLLTNSMNVEGADEASVIAAVEAAGYGASVKGKNAVNTPDPELEAGKEKRNLITRLISSLAILLPLMYISMGYVMWDFPLPTGITKNPLAIALIELILSAAVLIINQRFFINGAKGIIRRSPNMDTLVALGSGASFVWSVYLLFEMTFADAAIQHHYLHEFYFESAAMILTLITVGKMLESHAKGKTTDAIKSLIRLTPKTATVERGGKEIKIPSSEVRIDDVFLVRPGENVAVDGVVIDGESLIDESALTGESIPVEKSHGSCVYAATNNTSGFLRCKATKVGEDTTMARVVKMVSDAAATKAPIAKVADRVSGIFVPAVLAIAVVTVLIWIFVNNSLGYALARGISVLVISCPCALGLATPVAIMVGSGIGARGGVLFKNATSLEICGKAKTVALDKTGTITKGEPEVTDVIAIGADESELLSVAAALEAGSEHPLGKAIVKYTSNMGVLPAEARDFLALAGNGVYCIVGGDDCYAGSYKFISGKTSVSSEAVTYYEKLSDLGKTPIFFLKGDVLLGIIAVADTIREDSREAISELREMGIHTVMLTGDNERCARAIGSASGVDEIISGVMPEEKESVIKRLSEKGRVVMVGDGINDAPALTRADVGMAIGRGTDIAIEAADVVLVRSTLSDVASALKLSRATLKTIHENLFWAFIYNVIGIPLAAGAFISLLGWELNPMFGALAMSLSSFSVVMNALRLNLKTFFKKYEKTNNYTVKEKEKMVKVLEVEGMMCPHCEARVKEVLEALSGVISAEVSHKSGTAKLTLDEEISDAVLTDTVTNAGYKVKGIK